MQDIFPQPPIVAYKHNFSPRDTLVHSTDSSSTEQPGVKPVSSSLLSSIYQALRACSPSAIISPALRKILLTVSPASDASIFTSAKLGKVSGVELVSICKAYAKTPLGFLCHNISTPPATVLLMSRYKVCICAAKNWK